MLNIEYGVTFESDKVMSFKELSIFVKELAKELGMRTKQNTNSALGCVSSDYKDLKCGPNAAHLQFSVRTKLNSRQRSAFHGHLCFANRETFMKARAFFESKGGFIVTGLGDGDKNASVVIKDKEGKEHAFQSHTEAIDFMMGDDLCFCCDHGDKIFTYDFSIYEHGKGLKESFRVGDGVSELFLFDAKIEAFKIVAEKKGFEVVSIEITPNIA